MEEIIFEDDSDEVGSDIEAYCPKCKADTAHTIITKYEDEIRRVQCSPCGDVHSYRKPRGESEDDVPEPIAAKKRAALKKPTWEEARARVSDRALANARPYSIRDTYREGDVVTHPKFGLGFITEFFENKVEITFQDERRVLVHNRPDLAAQMPAIAPLPPPREDVKKGKKGAVKSADKAPDKTVAAPEVKGKSKDGKAAAASKPGPVLVSARDPREDVKAKDGKAAKTAAGKDKDRDKDSAAAKPAAKGVAAKGATRPAASKPAAGKPAASKPAASKPATTTKSATGKTDKARKPEAQAGAQKAAKATPKASVKPAAKGAKPRTDRPKAAAAKKGTAKAKPSAVKPAAKKVSKPAAKPARPAARPAPKSAAGNAGKKTSTSTKKPAPKAKKR